MLLIAATPAELRGHDGLVCGVGPVEAAAATSRRLAVSQPRAAVLVGIAGAREGAGLPVLGVVAGAEAVYEDLATSIPLAPQVAVPNARLAADVARALRCPLLPIGTSAAVGGTTGCPVEAMEGFAVLRAAELAGVPALEVRVISNLIGEPRARWRVDDALGVLDAVIPVVLTVLSRAAADPSPRSPR